MDNWLNPQIVEQARERHTRLQQAAAHRQLLQQLPPSTARWALFRTVALYTGNLLIATGTWLKERAMPTPHNGQLPTMAGRFS